MCFLSTWYSITHLQSRTIYGYFFFLKESRFKRRSITVQSIQMSLPPRSCDDRCSLRSTRRVDDVEVTRDVPRIFFVSRSHRAEGRVRVRRRTQREGKRKKNTHLVIARCGAYPRGRHRRDLLRRGWRRRPACRRLRHRTRACRRTLRRAAMERRQIRGEGGGETEIQPTSDGCCRQEGFLRFQLRSEFFYCEVTTLPLRCGDVIRRGVVVFNTSSICRGA